MRTFKLFISSLGIFLSLTTAFAQQTADDFGSATSSGQAGFCPALSITMSRGATDAATGGQVSQLQRFLIERNYLEIDQPTGLMRAMTVQAVKDFQADNGIVPSTGIAGVLTRAAIARVCAGGTTSGGTVCTADAMVCPNGSTVGRSGPNCQFVCPGTSTTGTTASVVLNTIGANSLTGQYLNVPANTTLVVFNKTLNQATSLSASLGNGGSQPFTLTFTAEMVNGAYSIRVINSSSQALVAESITFNVNRQATGTQTVPAVVPTVSLTVTTGYSDSIQAGVPTNLSWSTTGNPTTCTAKNVQTGASEAVSPSGSRTVYPSVTTTYRVECSNQAGSAAADKVITVTPAPSTNTGAGTPTIGLSVASSSIMQGGSTYIAWNTANADSCVANYAGKTESVATQQTQIVISPTQTTTYTLTCANGSYSAQKAVTVTVNPVTTTTGTTSGSTGTTGTTASTNTGAPTIGLSVAAASIVVGASTQIAWNTVNADSCLAYYNGRVEAVATQGLLTITPSTTTTYRLVCVNGATPAEKSVTVTVTPAVTALTTTGTNYPTFGLSAQSYRINAGDTTQIAWNTSDATTCTAYYNGVSENMALQGLISVSPATTTTYRLVCTNSTGSAERSITIVVTPR